MDDSEAAAGGDGADDAAGAAAAGDGAEGRTPDGDADEPDDSTAEREPASEGIDDVHTDLASPDASESNAHSGDEEPPGTETSPASRKRPADALPGPSLGERQRLNGRVQFVWEVRAVVLSALAGALAWVVATRLGLLPEWAVPAVAVGALALTTGYVRARFRLWRYEVRDDALYLERGVFTRVRTVVPLVRVQHTDTARNPVERTLGLASTVVYTAGSRGADVSVPGLTREDAESLQQLLKQLAVEAGDEDAV